MRPNLGFWKQLIDFEIGLFGTSSVKIINSTIGPIPDIYEAEVKNMQWGGQPNPNQSPSQMHKPITKGSYPDLSSDKPGLSLIPQASKISPRQAPKQNNRLHYTTTYNASYQKP